MNRNISILLVFLCMLGCSSSKITNRWKPETIPIKNYNKLMVVGILVGDQNDLREKMENHLVGDLKERGYPAISSLKEYGPDSFVNLKEEDAYNKLEKSGVDAVVTIVLLDKKREKFYVPGRIYYSPYSDYQNHLWNYYNTINSRIYKKGYYQVNTKYFWESNFYDLASKKWLYSVQTESFEPNSVELLAHQYGKLIVKDMVTSGVIK